MNTHSTRIVDPTLERAKKLGLWGAVAHWSELDPAVRQQLCDWQHAERHARSLKTRLAQARLGRFRPMAEFDWDWPKALDKHDVQDLLDLSFMADCANAVLIGPNSVGKTMIAKNIGHQALLAGHTVRYTKATTMLEDLAAQSTPSARKQRLRIYTSPHLLVLDEVAYQACDNRATDLLYEVLDRRYERRSTVVTAIRPFSKWNEVFPGQACAVTIIERLTHHSDILQIEADSYGLAESVRRRQEKLAGRSRR